MTTPTTNPDTSTPTGGKVSCRRNASGWWVYFPAERHGGLVRLRKRFGAEADARAFAGEKSEEIRMHGIRFGTLPDVARDAYRAYREHADLFAEKGIEPPPFDELVRQALDAFALQCMPGESSVAEGLGRFLEAKKPALSSNSYHSLRTRLRHFARSLGDRAMSSITATEIEDWLSKLPRRRSVAGIRRAIAQEEELSAHSWNHYRAALATFFAHAKEMGWIVESPVKNVRRVVAGPKPEVLTPEQAMDLMSAAREMMPSVLPALALQIFAGLRLAEAACTKLDGICVEQSATFHLEKSKGGSREVPVCDALRAWLAESPSQSGAAWPGSINDLRRKLAQVFIHAGCPANLESSRITYLRYRLQMTGDVARLAEESGARFALFDALARIPVAPEAAERFFQHQPHADR